MLRQRASLATAASFAERSDTRLSAPAATDLCRVLAIFHHFGAVFLGLFEFFVGLVLKVASYKC